MGDIFQGIKGGFNGYALENLEEGNPDPDFDTTDFDGIFMDEDLFSNKPIKNKVKQKDIFGGF